MVETVLVESVKEKVDSDEEFKEYEEKSFEEDDFKLDIDEP